MPEISGKVGGILGKYLYGWCYRPDHLTEKLILEIYCDGYSVGLVKADVFERQLQEQNIGDGHYGFIFGLPDYVLSKGKSVSVKLANSSLWLEPVLNLLEIEKKDQPPSFSQVYTNGGLRLHGWVWYPEQPGKSVGVSVYCDGKKLFDIKADKYTASFAKNLRKNSFDFTLPPEIADGCKHEIRLLDDSGRELNGSPVTIVEYFSGIDSLLKKSRSDSDAYHLLQNVVRQYQLYLPRSIGMEHYPAWYECYGTLSEGSSDTDIEFIFIGFDNAHHYKTLESLNSQGFKSWRWLTVERFLTAKVDLSLRKNVYCAFVSEGGYFPPNSLLALADALDKMGRPGILYTDSDQDSLEGKRSNPWFKPDWNYEYFTAFNYLNSLCLVRADLLINIGEFSGEDAFVYHAVARSLELGEKIRHLPSICYHRSSGSSNNVSSGHRRQLASLQAFLNKVEPGAFAQPQQPGSRVYRIFRPLHSRPLVSLIIPTRDRADLLKKCLDSLLHKTHYDNVEILVVNNQSLEDETMRCFEYYQSHGVRVIDYLKPFNYSAINNYAVNEAKGEIIGLLNNDVEVITSDWLEEMLGLLLRSSVGAVGAKLLWPNGMVQHGGVVLGVGGLAGHYGNHLHDQDAGYMYRNQVTQQLSAVTAACLLVRKSDYLAIGGLNEFDFPVAFNDVDFCLRLQEKGLRNIWSAHAKFWHFESASRGKEDNPMKVARAYRETQALKRYWGHMLSNDAHSPAALDSELNGLSLRR